MMQDIKDHNNSRKVVNKLKPYKDEKSGYIIHPVANWYECCIKYGDRYNIRRRKV